MQLDELARLIDRRASERGRPIVVGISGYGGSGKSTLARELVTRVTGSVRMRGDDFLDPVRSHTRSTDWAGVERDRLEHEVLAPFREGRPSQFRRYDWDRRVLSDPEPVPSGRVLIVDVIGLFHPETMHTLDLTVWCDVELATATVRGMRRDAENGHAHEALWSDVWVPNERDFDARFAPRSHAEVLFG